VHAAATKAKGIAILRHSNKHMVMAPEAIGILKIIAEREIPKVEFWVSASDNGANSLANNKMIISIQAITIRFLL